METSISKNFNPMVTKKSTSPEENKYTKYFVSTEHEFAFYFKMNNSIFDKYLGIKKIHTVDLSKAKELQNFYLRMFHPDHNTKSNTGLNYDEICADIKVTFFRVSGGKL